MKLRGLTHVYHSQGENVLALSGLDAEFESGAVVVVRGPNGSGKTTLVRILAGELVPTAGSVTFDNEVGRPRVVTINQFGNVISDLTAAEHRHLLQLSPDAVSKVANGARRAGHLEMAEQQHLAIDLAAAMRPDIVLADEPTAFLGHDDAVSAYRLLASRCRAANATLLIVTHDERAEQQADVVVRLRDGRLAEKWVPGQPEEQALDAAGWLRLPDTVRTEPGRGRTVRVAPTDRVWLEGVVPTTGIRTEPTTQSGRISHIVSQSSLIGLAKLQQLAAVHFGSAALFSDPTSLGTAQALRDFDPKEEAVALLDMSGLVSRPLATLSGGQRQRAFLAVALSHPAPVLLIDDPIASLDSHWRQQAMAALRQHAEAGHTVVIATRDEDATESGDQVTRL